MDNLHARLYVVDIKHLETLLNLAAQNLLMDVPK